jgi:vitamin B12 transporter
VLIDGVRSQIDGAGALTTTDLPLNQIEQVEVLRGNAGALYGESAIGGVINIITRSGKGAPRGYGSATIGSRKTGDLSVGYGGRVDGTSFDLNAGVSSTGGFSAMNPDKSASVNPDRDAYRNQYAAAKVDQRVDPTLRVGIRASFKNSVIDYDDSAWGAGLKTDVHQFLIKTDAVGGYFNKRLTEDWVTNFDATASNYSYDAFKNGAVASTDYYTGHQNVFRWSNNYAIHTSTALNFGLDQSTEKFQQRSSYDLNRDTTSYSVGMTSKWKRWSLQGNVRRDELTMNQLSGSALNKEFANNNHLLGVGYQLSEPWRLTSTTSTAFRAPTGSELAFGGPTLLPETHRAQEFGVVYSVKKALMRVVYFQTRTQDAIDWVNNGYNNVGEVRNRGYEFTARLDVWSNNVKASFVSQDPWNVTDNYLPGRRAKKYGSFDISRWISGYEVGTKFIGVSDRGDINSGSSETLAGYTTWTFYASRKIDTDWTARVKLENAFNRNYELAGGYNTPGRGIFATLQYQPK